MDAYGCRFGHHHVVDPRTGQLLKCSREAPALAAVEAESCALADALATALLVAGSVAEARALGVRGRGRGAAAAAGDARLAVLQG